LLYSLKLRHSWMAGHVPLRKPLPMLTPKCGDSDLVCDSLVNIPQIAFWNEWATTVAQNKTGEQKERPHSDFTAGLEFRGYVQPKFGSLMVQTMFAQGFSA
jgi:hypothetical protein